MVAHRCASRPVGVAVPALLRLAGGGALYNFRVRAAAILHTYLKADVVDPFRDARVNVFRGNTLEPNDLPDVAMVFGGDGSVHRVLPALAYSGIPLLVVPCGSANDFARCIGIPNRAEALSAWRRFLEYGDNVRTVDMGTVHPICDPVSGATEKLGSETYADADGRIAPPEQLLGPQIVRRNLLHAEESAEQQRTIYFTGIAGVGLDAETNQRAERMPGWLRRHGGYMVAALRSLATYRAPRIQLHSFDLCGTETRLDGPILFAAIGNAPEYGSGIRMLPRAEMSDGQLDLCFVPAMPVAKVLRHIHKIYSGTHVQVPEVRYLRTSQVFLESEQAIPIWADGEYLCQTPAEIAVAPKALCVIVP
jgi:diacylglycerol kinase (ATP)